MAQLDDATLGNQVVQRGYVSGESLHRLLRAQGAEAPTTLAQPLLERGSLTRIQLEALQYRSTEVGDP
ncbi:MAG: hypothetical protein HYZ53_17630 [Planctomycetes bacterium]|nr:hypothetical protein [Planctomycetota bacterium]